MEDAPTIPTTHAVLAAADTTATKVKYTHFRPKCRQFSYAKLWYFDLIIIFKAEAEARIITTETEPTAAARAAADADITAVADPAGPEGV